VARDPARTLFDYFERIDAGDPLGAVAHFTEDARAEVMTGKVIRGRERIGRALERILAAYERTSHHATNLRWDDGPDGRITLWSYVYAYHRMRATGASWHLWVRLRDVLVRDPDGTLRIAEHQLIGVDSIPSREDIPAEWYPGHPGRDSPRLPARGQRLKEALELAAPDVVKGMHQVQRAAIECGLPESEAALVTACAAAVRGQPDTLISALARAKEAGLAGAWAWGAPAVLLVSRGEEAALRLTRGLLETYGSASVPPPRTYDEIDDPYLYFEEYFGALPERLAILARSSQTAFAGYARAHRAALRGGPLPSVLVELILCGVNAADLQTEFVRVHAEAARRVGASEGAVLGAVLAAIPISGLAAWAAAAPAIRPDAS
jgi:alkylhydroperoxidase/carboxymuconolactone decarboxylase family protein YurZ/ketosteroid isomerase-like protein